MLVFKYAHTISDGWTRLAGQSIYAILHALDGKALDFSSSLATMLPFDGDHDRFGLDLTEDGLRTNFFRSLLASGVDYLLTDSLPGVPYSVEYWATAASGTKSRSTDSLLKVEEYPWADNSNIDPVLFEIQSKTQNIPDEPAESRYEAMVAFVFDSTINRIGFSCWLEKDGQLQDDSTTCILTLVDSTGIEIFSTNVPAATGPNAIAGFFAGQVLAIALVPDEAYTARCDITDADGNVHSTGSAPVTWD